MLDLSECQDLLGSRLPHLRVLPASGGIVKNLEVVQEKHLQRPSQFVLNLLL